MLEVYAILIEGLALGLLFCLLLVLAIHAVERGRFRKAKPRTGALAPKPPSDEEVRLLLADVENGGLDLDARMKALSILRLRADSALALELLRVFTQENPTRLRREILRSVWSMDQGIWTATLLLEVLKQAALPMMLRLDAAEILLHVGSLEGVALVRRLVLAPQEAPLFKVRLLRLLDWTVDSRCAVVAAEGVRAPEADVRAAAVSLVRRMSRETGEAGEELRGALTKALAESIELRSGLGVVAPQIRALIEIEENSGRASETVERLLRRALIIRDEEAAAAAAEGLGRLRVEAAVGDLKKALYGRSDLVRAKAVEALGRLGASNLVPKMGFIAQYEELARIQKAATPPPRPLGGVRGSLPHDQKARS